MHSEEHLRLDELTQLKHRPGSTTKDDDALEQEEVEAPRLQVELQVSVSLDGLHLVSLERLHAFDLLPDLLDAVEERLEVLVLELILVNDFLLALLLHVESFFLFASAFLAAHIGV